MRVLRIPLLAYAAILALAVACKDHRLLGDCFEGNATAYRTDLLNDTSLTFSWPASYAPVRYYAENTGALRANVDIALHLWADAFRCGEMSMVRVADSSIADVIIRNPPQMPPFGAPRPHALFAGAGDSLNACDARTDIDVDTVTHRVLRPIRIFIAPADLDTAAVSGCYRISTAHEIGHSLGLLAHSTNA